MTLQTITRQLKPYELQIKSGTHHTGLYSWLIKNLPIEPIRNARVHGAYSKVIELLMGLIGSKRLSEVEVRDLRQYISMLAPAIEHFERKNYPIRSATAEQVLKFLMEQHGLNQDDLSEDLGGQPVVSDIIHGKRKLTREHIERLSKRFHISPATFFPD